WKTWGFLASGPEQKWKIVMSECLGGPGPSDRLYHSDRHFSSRTHAVRMPATSFRGTKFVFFDTTVPTLVRTSWNTLLGSLGQIAEAQQKLEADRKTDDWADDDHATHQGRR